MPASSSAPLPPEETKKHPLLNSRRCTYGPSSPSTCVTHAAALRTSDRSRFAHRLEFGYAARHEPHDAPDVSRRRRRRLRKATRTRNVSPVHPFGLNNGSTERDSFPTRECCTVLTLATATVRCTDGSCNPGIKPRGGPSRSSTSSAATSAESPTGCAPPSADSCEAMTLHARRRRNWL